MRSRIFSAKCAAHKNILNDFPLCQNQINTGAETTTVTTSTIVLMMTDLQHFMKTLLNNYEGAPPEIVSDNARIVLSSCCCPRACSGCCKTRTTRPLRQQAGLCFALNEANTTTTGTQGEDNRRLTRWESTTTTNQSLHTGTGRGHRSSSFLPLLVASPPPPRRELSNSSTIFAIGSKRRQLRTALLTSRNVSSKSRPPLYRHASLPPIRPKRKQSVEMLDHRPVLVPSASN
jgi:hypothetical protein